MIRFLLVSASTSRATRQASSSSAMVDCSSSGQSMQSSPALITSASLNAHCDLRLKYVLSGAGAPPWNVLMPSKYESRYCPSPSESAMMLERRTPCRLDSSRRSVSISLPVLYGLSIASLAAIPVQLNATKRSRPFMARSALIRRTPSPVCRSFVKQSRMAS